MCQCHFDCTATDRPMVAFLLFCAVHLHVILSNPYCIIRQIFRVMGFSLVLEICQISLEPMYCLYEIRSAKYVVANNNFLYEMFLRFKSTILQSQIWNPNLIWSGLASDLWNSVAREGIHIELEAEWDEAYFQCALRSKRGLQNSIRGRSNNR